jgi:hypothetical protein
MRLVSHVIHDARHGHLVTSGTAWGGSARWSVRGRPVEEEHLALGVQFRYPSYWRLLSVGLERSGSKWHATDTSTGSVQSRHFAIAHIGSSNRSRGSSTSSSSPPAPSSSTGASSSSRSTPSPRSSSAGKRYPCCSRSPPTWPPVGPINPFGSSRVGHNDCLFVSARACL